MAGFCLERTPDPDENLIIECFENSGISCSKYITKYIKDFKRAQINR